MKITDVKCLILDQQFPFVRVDTDEGLVGIGECFPYAQEYNIEPHSIRDEWPVLKNSLQVKGGYLDVPDGPGLGIELDEGVVNRLAQL